MTECRVWTGARSKGGYGQKWRDGKVRYMHRWVWEQFNGPIPPGMVLLHLCDNPPCYRLDHLHLGSQHDNINDAKVKGRLWARRRIDRDELVRRYLAGESSAALAKEFGCAQPTVAKYARRVDPVATRARHGRGRWTNAG